MRPQRMDEPPAHALDLRAAARRPGDRRGELVAGDGMAGKAERLERAELCREWRQAAPSPRRDRADRPIRAPVERSGIGQAAAADLLGDHEVEPGSAPAAEKISGAQDDGAHAALGGLRHAILDRDAQLPLARRRPHRRRLVDHGRQRLAVIVEIAGKQQRGARGFGRRDGRIGERQSQPRPVRYRAD